jgi:nucleoside-diphosphate-sugar epimerase
MKVFVTGASGHIGSVVVPELLKAGHQVIGLTRSDQSAETLRKAGAEVHRGSLDDLDSLKRAAQAADGVIHLAFRHDLAFSGDMEGATKADLKALEAFGEALAGTGKPLVGVGGTLMLAYANLGRTGLETDVLESGPRIDAENFVIGLARKNVRSSVVRLAPTVHGPLDNTTGFMPTFIRIAREKGLSAYIDEGANRWPAVHELDAAYLFRLALEAAPAGTRLHGVGDQGIAFKEIAETIGHQLNVPVTSISAQDAIEHFSHLSTFAALDNPASSAATQATLNWHPAQPGLIEDLREGDYFKV